MRGVLDHVTIQHKGGWGSLHAAIYAHALCLRYSQGFPQQETIKQKGIKSDDCECHRTYKSELNNRSKNVITHRVDDHARLCETL